MNIIEEAKRIDLIISKFNNLICNKFEANDNFDLLGGHNILEYFKLHKIKLSLSEESEWMQYFNEQKQRAEELKIKIDKTDREIDHIVYELYGLTEQEINIVEEANA